MGAAVQRLVANRRIQAACVQKRSLNARATCRLTMRAPDWWESARFQAVFVAQGWFRQSGVVSSRPPAGNASRSAAPPIPPAKLSLSPIIENTVKNSPDSFYIPDG